MSGWNSFLAILHVSCCSHYWGIRVIALHHFTLPLLLCVIWRFRNRPNKPSMSDLHNLIMFQSRFDVCICRTFHVAHTHTHTFTQQVGRQDVTVDLVCSLITLPSSLLAALWRSSSSGLSTSACTCKRARLWSEERNWSCPTFSLQKMCGVWRTLHVCKNYFVLQWIPLIEEENKTLKVHICHLIWNHLFLMFNKQRIFCKLDINLNYILTCQLTWPGEQ